MSHPKGTYLGGMRTVEDLRERCQIDKATGCWHWGLSMCEGHPRLWLSEHVPGMAKATRVTGPRGSYILKHGKPPPAKHKAYMRCLTADCVNPEHVVAWTREQHGQFMSKIGVWRDDPHRIAVNRNNKRQHAKLTIEMAREIRASTETQTALGRRYNVPQSTIGYVKLGKLWPEDTEAPPLTRSVAVGEFVYCSRAGAVGVGRDSAEALGRLRAAA